MKENIMPKAYACYSQNPDVRAESTSGGIFTLLATYFMENMDAVVYGAVFDENFNVCHIKVSEIKDLKMLRGSKYPQSNKKESFKEIKMLLQSNRNVFFAGTPCEVNGLKAFLGTNYENLYTLDFVCHGVASDGIWSVYVNKLRKNGYIKKIIFKSKPKSWKKWYFRVEYLDKTWERRGSMVSFMRSYLSYCNIRPSCYQCRFKGIKRNTDFTISDCWGIAESNEELNDDKGLSALLLQNIRAVDIFGYIENQMCHLEYDADELMQGNWTAIKSVEPNPIRTNFFKEVKKNGAIHALNKYFSPTVKNWLGYYYKRIKKIEK